MNYDGRDQKAELDVSGRFSERQLQMKTKPDGFEARNEAHGTRNVFRPAPPSTGHRALITLVLWSLILGPCTFPPSAGAFPPAPHHLFVGLVRDELGNPLRGDASQVIFVASSGVRITAPVITGIESGANYELAVPMDAGITSDLYQPTALRPLMPFAIQVKVGSRTYLPLEMSGDLRNLGQPGGVTRLNLTLGEDADGDGLPDAWERALLQSVGSKSGIETVRPGDDADGDGLSNLQEYLAGTYAYDPEDGFTLKIARFNQGVPELEFLAIRGRTYTVLGSADLKQWSVVQFRIPAEDPVETARGNYFAEDIRTLRIETLSPAQGPPPRFFKLKLD